MLHARTPDLRAKPLIVAVVLALAFGAGAIVEGASAAPSNAPERAVWSAGAVRQGTGYDERGGSERVREVQASLRRLELLSGRVDGRFGRRTKRAVRSFQRANSLRPDGVVGSRTLALLRAESAGLNARSRSLRSVTAPPALPVHPGPRPLAAAVPREAPPAARTGGFDATWPAIFVVLLTLTVLLADALVRARGRTRRGRTAPPRSVLPPAAEPAAPAALHLNDGTGAAPSTPGPRLGELLLDAGALSEDQLAEALAVQARSGGRLGEILVAYDLVPAAALTVALARRLHVETVQPDDRPVELLSSHEAQAWRAVALDGPAEDVIAVAVGDPSAAVLEALEARLGRPVVPRLCDEATLDELRTQLYGTVDADEVIRGLREEAPELSASRTALSRTQTVVACVLGIVLVVGLVVDLGFTASVLVGIATAFFVASTGFRLYAAQQGSLADATVDPPADELAAMEERHLPTYTVLLPLYKEKPPTVEALLESLSRMDYPKHKLDVLALTEDDDEDTRAAIETVGRPPWMRVLQLPPGVPRTKPRAMGIGLRYARGAFVTVYDAEDKPDPAQLKKAVWGFAHGDATLACLQGKLSYYNPRQNLLTRWFTLEYDAWFNIFLPGLHRMGAPIPLGGTSNHFRRHALDACLGWDPYNVTEDADLGLRFARLGFTTAMLESTTGEEANSRVANWIRQRSRWSKGYMQTLLVHTRRPRTLLRELGFRATAAFLLTLGGAVVTALLAPIFWVLLVLWFLFEPNWVAALFPGPFYYAASVSLLLGNFALVFLGLIAAVRRGHDDLAPHALLFPIYWALMSVATYVALVELVVRPHYWHKTEHALHLVEEPA